MRRAGSLIAFVITLIAAVPGAATAQEPPSPPPSPVLTIPAAPQPPQPPEHAGPRKGPNVRVEVTIKDQKAGGPPLTKNVSVVVAAGEHGRVRTLAQRRGPFQPSPLNVDVYPWIQDPGRIAVRLVLEYGNTGPAVGTLGPDGSEAMIVSPVGPEPAEPPAANVPSVHVGVNESLTVVLEDGKPMLVTQSADPVTDRKVTVEVKATILK